MRKKGLILLLAWVFVAVATFPMPECYFTKVNCPLRGTGSCKVFAGKCQSNDSVCGQTCPFSHSNQDQQKPKTCYEQFRKVTFYPVQSWLDLSPKEISIFPILVDTSLAYGPTLRDGRFTQPVHGCERASPLFMKNQSFLI